MLQNQDYWSNGMQQQRAATGQGNYTGCSGAEKGTAVIELGSSRYEAEPRWVKRSPAAPAVQDGLSLVRI
ncbi:hypothetical protein F0562_013357 [Nyssa sinensis]|uniref:Uncharacterized protein n=1 Tax=Nyssa sinensis TaxID=561372 RepID=A0A5J4ZPX0_9ASTE|nr:hypothetical protein F0562_013357 [Nyssa sinensis]